MNGILKRFIYISHGLYFTMLISILIGIILFPIKYQAFIDTANAGMRRTFTPRISVYREYDDNIDLDSTNEISDWITMISPGFSLNLDSPKTKLGLDFETRYAFYKRDSDRDTTLHNGTFNWEQPLTRKLKLDVRDTFSRSDDPILVNEEGQIEVEERRIYYRNNGQIDLSLRFGVDSSIGLGYRNLYLHYPDSNSTDYEDRRGHEFLFNLNTSFIPSFGIGLESRINRGRFIQPPGFPGEFSEDFIDHEGVITLTYRWHVSRSLFARYSFLDKNFDDPGQGFNNMDFRLHQGSLGLSVGLSPHINFSAEAGYYFLDFLQDIQGDLEKDGGSFNVVLNTQKRKATVSLGGSGGYAQDYFSSENLGSSEFQQIFGSANYLLSENLSSFVSANYRWNKFFREDNQRNRKDKVWRASAGFNFSFSDWLTLYIEGTHSERESESDDPEVEDFMDNRIMLRLTGAYPILF